MPTAQRQFDSAAWRTHPPAADCIGDLVAECLSHSDWLCEFSRNLREQTGTRLIDWIDALVVTETAERKERLRESGFAELESRDHTFWRHADGLFPSVFTADRQRQQVYLKVESVADFVEAHHLAGSTRRIEGEPYGQVRFARIDRNDAVECRVVERHGVRSWAPGTIEPQTLQAVVYYSEAFRFRPRHHADTADGFARVGQLIGDAIAELDDGRVCDLFFAAERSYWRSRNRAARVQKARQDRLGLGWGNHDHHTYRSSREHFHRLIEVFELLGFECRERLYAGEKAGWGAQVLEHRAADVVIFADVDLSPEEVAGDFAHEPLASRPELGTVGLWCALHGEAFFEAGMHHLECRFDFELAREQLRAEGIETIPPFTDLPYLRQAFTVGERWPVSPRRIETLLAAGSITPEQAATFRAEGAIGSHLELLQREQGYKGFDTTGIDEIIHRTDPRSA